MRTFIIEVDEPFPLLDEQRLVYEAVGFEIDSEDGGVDTSEHCYPLQLEMNGLNPLIDKMMECGIDRNHGMTIKGDHVTLFYREI